MKNFLFFLFLFSLTINCLGQNTFQKVYGVNLGIEGYDMQQTIDSGFIVTGLTFFSNPFHSAPLLMKTDKYGNLTWKKKYGVTNINFTSYSVRQTLDNGFIIAGTVDTIGKRKIFLLKTDSNGNLIWNKIFQTINDSLSCASFSVRQATNGGYILCGYIGYSLAQPTKALLIKTDSLGNLVWAKTYNKLQTISSGSDVQNTSDGGFILIGAHNVTVPFNTRNIFLMKVDSNGIPLWNRTFGAMASDSLDIWGGWHIETVFNGYVFTGALQELSGATYVRTFLLKTDLNGNFLWNKVYKIIQTDEAGIGYSVKSTDDNGFILCGGIEDSTDNDDIYLIKTDSVGNLVWNRTFGTLADAEKIGYYASPTLDNGFAVLARNYDYNIGIIYLIKTDSIGNSGCFQLNFTVPVESKTFWDSVATLQVDSFVITDTSFVFQTANDSIDTVTLCSSTPTSVEENYFENGELDLFPNPTNGILFINGIKSESIIICNSLGEIVRKVKAENKIDLSELSEGLYLIQVIESSGKFIHTAKILKQQ